MIASGLDSVKDTTVRKGSHQYEYILLLTIKIQIALNEENADTQKTI